MASSSSIPKSAVQDTTQGTSMQQETPSYDIKGRTMSLKEWDLNVQVERPVDFISLAHDGCDIRSYYGAQISWKQDPLDVQLYFIHDYLKSTGEEIQLQDIPETMYGGALPVAKIRKTKRKELTKDEYLDEASEHPAKKAKKAKTDKKAKAIGSGSTIQEEVQDLEPVKVLNKRTRSGKEALPSPPQPSQPSIPKRKRKPVVRKLKIASEEE